jgi:hypothetical protein
MDKKVLQAGQINIVGCDILTASGHGLEVSSIVEKIVIYEDIFSPFVSGEITLRDTFDIPNTIGNGSTNLLRLNLNTPSFSESKNINAYFLIYKLADRQLASDRSQFYTYKFCSEEVIYDVQRKISKTYRGTGDSIIKDIMSDKFVTTAVKNLDADSSNNEITYTSNFWSPTQNFRYVVEHSLDDEDNPSFVFFENRNGFNFKSLTKLAKQESLMQYYVASDFMMDVETGDKDIVRFGSATRNPNNDYSIIREIRVDSTFDYLDFISKGGSRSILYTHDLVTKRVDIQKFELVKENHTLLNNNRFVSDAVISNTEPQILTASKYWNALDEMDRTNTKFLQKRISQLAQYQSFKIEIDAPGRTDYAVGGKVYIDVNQIRAISVDEDKKLCLDKMYSGYYIVAKLAHHITRREHLVTMELIKDSTLL